jgi:uncharacterized RDD family membrane protein YckC
VGRKPGTGAPAVAAVRQNGTVTVALHRPQTALENGEVPVVTGEAVPLDIRVARLGSRVLALLIDLFVQVVLFSLLAMLLGVALGLAGSTGLVDGALVQALFVIVLPVVVYIGYPTVMLTLTRGRTVGKLALGLRVVRDDGGPVGFRHSLTRSVVGAVVEFPGLFMPFIGWALSIVLMTTSPLSKRLGDYTAGTFVIHERNLEAWGWVPAMPPGLAGWASTLDLAGLDDDLALAVRHFLARNRRFREPARTRLGQQLAREVARVTSPPPPPGTPGWAYLAAVHAERHARAMRRLATVRGRASSVWPELVAAIEPPRPAPVAAFAPLRAGVPGAPAAAGRPGGTRDAGFVPPRPMAPPPVG